jgi:hypothetical protein
MSDAVAIPKMLGGWLLGRAADFAICLSLSVAFLLSDEKLPIMGDLTFGALAFGVIYLPAGFLITSIAWWWFGVRRSNLSAVAFALGSAALLVVTLVGIHLFAARFERAEWSWIANPILLSGVALHGLSTRAIRKYTR